MIESGRINIKRPCNGYYLRWWYNGFHYWWFLPGTMTYDTEGQEYYTLGTQKVAVGSGQISYAQCQAIRTILNTREVDVWTDVGWKSLKIERDSVIVYDNKVDGYEIEFVIIIGSRHISDTGYSPIETMPPVVPPVWVSSCPNGNIVIGTQVWSSCNYDILYPGSQVYDNDEANRALFGGLYTWSQVTASGFCPTGWHLPTVAEWNTMITFIGGAATAGDKLKAIGNTYWDPVNNGTDDYLFGGRGSGYGSGGSFNGMYLTGDFWTADEYTSLNASMFRLWNDQSLITQSNFPKTTYLAVRLIRDGSVYQGLGALYNWYAVNNETMKNVYGALYNYYAVTNSHNIAPTGWHIPTVAEYEALETFLGGELLAGGHLKESGLAHWDNPNTDADNSSLFTALGAGVRSELGVCNAIKQVTSFQTIDRDNTVPGMPDRGIFSMDFFSGGSYFGSEVSNKSGSSIRLIKDDSTDPSTMTDYDGNIYNTVKIDTQVWMKENLKVEHYNDGTAIPIITDDAIWAADIDGAMCYYNNL